MPNYIAPDIHMSRWLIATFLFATTVFSCVATFGFLGINLFGNAEATWGQGASAQVSIYVALTIALFCAIGSGLVFSIREKHVPNPAIVFLGALVLVAFLFLVNRFVSSIQNFTILWCVFGAAGTAYITTLPGNKSSP